MTYHSKPKYEIKYKLTAEMPILSRQSESLAQKEDGRVFILGSSLLGAARNQYRQSSSIKESEVSDSTERLLFGNITSASNMFFTDALCTNHQDIELRSSVSINRSTKSSD